MGVATGVFQLPNGSPVANGAYQWKLSQDAIQVSVGCMVPVLFGGTLDSNGNLTSTFAFNDVLYTAAGTTTTYQLTIKALGGGQVWNENYYLTGTAANLNVVLPGSSSSGPVLYPFTRVAEIGYVIDGNGTAVAAGVKGQVNVPLGCIITGWVLTADQSGSAVVDVNSGSYASFPTLASIAGTDKPTLTSAQKNQNLSVNAGNWTTTLLAGSQVQFSVTSATTVQRLNVAIVVNIPYGF